LSYYDSILCRYCTDVNGTDICDPYFNSNDVSLIQAIPGIASGIISSEYMPGHTLGKILVQTLGHILGYMC